MSLRKIANNLIHTPPLFTDLAKYYKRQQRFMRGGILLELEAFKRLSDQSLTEEDFKKISFYYGLAVPVIGDIYGILSGSKMTHAERQSLTYLGGLTGLFDDFFDERNTPEEHIKEMINYPDVRIVRNSHEKLFVEFYLKALDLNDSGSLKRHFNTVYEAQILSKKQKSMALSPKEILFITQQKGGASILFYRSVLAGNISDLEQSLLAKIGLLGQLENDIFDLYKDHRHGIRTLATVSKSMLALRDQYRSILLDVYDLIDRTDFQKRNKKKFSRMIAIIASRAFVALNQLIKLENEGIFAISRHPRASLICDMGQFKNIFRWLGFYLNWNVGTKY